MDTNDYYMEWWETNGTADTPQPANFTIKPSSLNYFLKRFVNGAEKRGIVYLRNATTQQVHIDKRPEGI